MFSTRAASSVQIGHQQTDMTSDAKIYNILVLKIYFYLHFLKIVAFCFLWTTFFKCKAGLFVKIVHCRFTVMFNQPWLGFFNPEHEFVRVFLK